MNVFITGATGRLGNYVVKELYSEGYSLTLLSRRGSKLVRSLFPGYDFKVVEKDINSLGVNDIKGNDIVVHLAGSVDFNNPTMYDTNVLSTRKMVELSNLVDVKHFIHMSSIAVYGKINNSNITEDTPLKGDTLYARSKILSENYVNTFNNKFTILRPSMIFGKGFYSGFKLAYQLIKSGKYVYIGRGDNHIPLVSANDVARAVGHVVSKNLSGVYNVSNPRILTQRELVGLVAQYLKVSPPHYSLPLSLVFSLVNLVNLLGYKKVHPEFIEMLSKDRRIISEKIIKDGFNFEDLETNLFLFLNYLKSNSY